MPLVSHKNVIHELSIKNEQNAHKITIVYLEYLPLWAIYMPAIIFVFTNFAGEK